MGMYQRNSAPMCRDSHVETLLPNHVLIFLTLCAKMLLEKNANQSQRQNVRMFHERSVSRLRENIARLFQGKRLPHASRMIVAQFKINHVVKCPDKRVNRSLNKCPTMLMSKYVAKFRRSNAAMRLNPSRHTGKGKSVSRFLFKFVRRKSIH